MDETTSGDGGSDTDAAAEAAAPPHRPSPGPVDPMARSGLDPDVAPPSPTPAAPSPTTEVPPAEVPAAQEPAAEAPRPAPGPRHAASDPEPARHPRRWFLAGAGVAVLAGAGGVGAALLRSEPAPTPNPAPEPLRAAISAERALLADLDATTGGSQEVRQVLVQVRADHAAHLQALLGAASAYDAAPRPVPTASGTARSAAQLRANETRAATVAAGHAAALDGRVATLLASIAACEAGHAELLS